MTMISFIIPTKNESKYLKDCLKSIERLNCEKEIIVVDATDDKKTKRLTKKYNGKFIYEKRKGPSIARNTGAKKAKGDILVFTDADVRFCENFCKNLDKYDAGIFDLRFWDGKGILENFLFALWNRFIKCLINLGFVMTNGSCFLYKKNVFEKIGGFNKDLLTNEDNDLAKRASKITKFSFIPKIVHTSNRRMHKQGTVKYLKNHIISTLTYLVSGKSYEKYWE